MKTPTTKRFRTGALFECENCGKQFQDHYTARHEAYDHAKNTGHSVRGEIATAYHYN